MILRWPPKRNWHIRLRLSGSGFAWIDRPLDLRRKGRKNYWRGGRPDGRGRGDGETSKSPWRGSACGARGRSPWWSGPPPPASTAAAATPCERRRTSQLSRCLFLPCRVAGGPTADRGRGVIMHTGVNVQGRPRSVAIATPFLSPLSSVIGRA